MNTQDVDKRLIANDPEFNMYDDKIVRSVLHHFNNTPPSQENEKLSIGPISDNHGSNVI